MTDTYKPSWVPEEENDKFACRVMYGVTGGHEGTPGVTVDKKDKVTPAIKRRKLEVDDYVEGVLKCDRAILSRAITLVESNAAAHFETAQQVIQKLLPYTGKSTRVGITGVPGAGKSTFIEALGTNLCRGGHKVAVLAVDPSSTVTKGSILGDKTRMEHRIARAVSAGGISGGVAGAVAGSAVAGKRAERKNTASKENQGLSMEQRAAKRVLDIIVSGLGIIVSSPIMLIIAIAVKAYDGGPVFYLQDRLTYQGKKFRIRKFRSMCVDSEKNGARLASKHDSRITPVGHVLRNLHLDELPQLFNVFMGDMSLVGPRPERDVIMQEYEQEIPEFHYRLKVKAGLTGYAQVYGKYNTTPYDKLKLDLFYIENYSFLLDIKLLFMTVKIFFQKEVSEGVDDNQKNALKDSEDKK